MIAYLQHKRKTLDRIEVPEKFPRRLHVAFTRNINGHIFYGLREFTYEDWAVEHNRDTKKNYKVLLYNLTGISLKG